MLSTIPGLVPLVLCTYVAEHVTGQFRLLILVEPCWMEGSWLLTVVNMLKDIPYFCPIIRNVQNVSVGRRVLSLLHLTL